MKTLFLSLAVTVAILASTIAQAGPALLPSFKGKINNYTSLPNNTLSLRVDLDCSYKKGIVWPETVSCGSEVLNVPVANDGTFVVPDMKWQKKKSINNYRFSVGISSTAGTSDSSIEFVAFDQKEIYSASKKLAEMSIYELPTLKVNAVTPTGESYATWRGMIDHPSETVNDPCVELILNVQAAEELNIHNPWVISKGATDKREPGVLKSIYFATKGNPGIDLQVKGSLYYKSSKPECKVNQSKVKFENAVEVTGTLSQVHKTFMNSSYKVD